MPLVTTAVVPVAGLGTRLLPATKSQPKEMLPVGGKPVVQHVVEELAAAGIERVVFVTGRGKGAIEDHFDRDPVLRAALERRGDQALLRRLAFEEELGLSFAYTRQREPLGLGDAVLCAEGLGGEAPFAVALGDAILRGPHDTTPIVQRLADALEQHDAACAIAVRDVPRAETSRYGIVATRDTGRVVRVDGVVEKPEPDAAPSTLAIAARYVMTPAIFAALRATPRAPNGELELTDAIARLVDEGETVVAVRLGDTQRYDVGTPESHAAAFLAFALTDPDHGERLRAVARALLDEG
ncbi:MAG: UTP--glucose-1-phosphate uridylyltransferase [Solirubrobacteraceae bacterium]